MAPGLRSCLIGQFDRAWKLTRYHLDDLSDDECLWRPAARGAHVRRTDGGAWRADWPEDESYGVGPPSIAWLTWHIDYWWSMVLDHSFGAGELSREQVEWAGGARAVQERIAGLESEWRTAIEALSPEDLASTDRSRWPFRRRPFADVVAWVNTELTKNASEVGYVRFLYAVRPDGEP